MGKFICTALFVCFITVAGYAQPHNLAGQVPKEHTYNKDEVIDPTYGIEMYEPFNYQLEGDSVRNCAGYACQAWIEDFYEDGTLLHKGYYLDGQVKVYKNYYPNGQLEREFKNLDNFRTMMKKFYDDGTPKSEVRYVEGTAIEWTDYYPNGQIEYHEKYHKSFSYHLERQSFTKDGKPTDEFLCVDKKKLNFSKKEYHDNGQLKTEGALKYDKKIFDFYHTGKWNHYDDAGKLVKVVTYNKGKIEKEQTF